MAHSCPDCDQVCHCGGDIDDCILDGTEEQDNCIHWKQCADKAEWLEEEDGSGYDSDLDDDIYD